MKSQAHSGLLFVLILIYFVPNLNCASEEQERVIRSSDIDYKKLCNDKVCVAKCCPIGEYIFGFNKKCKRPKKTYPNLTFEEVSIYDKDRKKIEKNFTKLFTFVPGRLFNEKFNESAVDFYLTKQNFFLTEEGILYKEVPNNFGRWSKFHLNTFCVDYQLPIKKINLLVPEVRFLVMVNVTTPPPDNPLICAGFLVSSFFLLLVLIVYGILRELRNLSGMVLMAYVACLLIAFVLLATIQLRRYSNLVCRCLTYATYFFLLSSFCWMNIMSCDIWWTFRGYAKARPIHRRGETFKFLMYCIYAFGLPLFMTKFLITVNEINMLFWPWFVTPNVPKISCFLGGEEKLLYLYIPMLILIICNWIFFLMTAFNIWRLHRATAVLDSAAAGTPAAHRSQKYRFLVYLKLSVIMGVNWVLEVVSSFQPDFQFWYISDIYNVLIGISIFLIFVCKRKILNMLIKKFQGLKGQKQRKISKSRSSHTTESDISHQDTPICINPQGSVFTYPG